MKRKLKIMITILAVLSYTIFLCGAYKIVYEKGYMHGYERALLDMQEYMLQKHGAPHGGNTEQK